MLKPTLTAIVNQTGNSSKTSSDSVSVEMVENIVQGIIIKQIELKRKFRVLVSFTYHNTCGVCSFDRAFKGIISKG